MHRPSTHEPIPDSNLSAFDRCTLGQIVGQVAAHASTQSALARAQKVVRYLCTAARGRCASACPRRSAEAKTSDAGPDKIAFEVNPIHQPASTSPSTAVPGRTQRGWTVFKSHGRHESEGIGDTHNPMHGDAAPDAPAMTNNPMRAPSANSSSRQPAAEPSDVSASPPTGANEAPSVAVPVTELGEHEQFDVVRTSRGETLSL